MPEARTIPLEAADFWRLRAQYAETRVVALEAKLSVVQAQARLAAAIQALATTYSFDPAAALELEEETLTLTVGAAP